jgi:hypothetical protein
MLSPRGSFFCEKAAVARHGARLKKAVEGQSCGVCGIWLLSRTM